MLDTVRFIRHRDVTPLQNIEQQFHEGQQIALLDSLKVLRSVRGGLHDRSLHQAHKYPYSQDTKLEPYLLLESPCLLPENYLKAAQKNR